MLIPHFKCDRTDHYCQWGNKERIKRSIYVRLQLMTMLFVLKTRVSKYNTENNIIIIINMDIIQTNVLSSGPICVWSSQFTK